MPLSAEAGRVLGCLVEKQLTTPQQYPLTLNALTSATNQATNRDPVVSLDDDVVLAALDELRGDHLVRVVLPSHGRSVKRYRQVLDEVYGLDATRYGLLAALLLRGDQTAGELRARTERMIELESVDGAYAELTALADHADGLVRLLPRQPGQKEDRWQQTVAVPWVTTGDPADPVEPPGSSGGSGTGDGGDRREADTDRPGPRSELEALREEVVGSGSRCPNCARRSMPCGGGSEADPDDLRAGRAWLATGRNRRAVPHTL